MVLGALVFKQLRSRLLSFPRLGFVAVFYPPKPTEPANLGGGGEGRLSYFSPCSFSLC